MKEGRPKRVHRRARPLEWMSLGDAGNHVKAVLGSGVALVEAEVEEKIIAGELDAIDRRVMQPQHPFYSGHAVEAPPRIEDRPLDPEWFKHYRIRWGEEGLDLDPRQSMWEREKSGVRNIFVRRDQVLSLWPLPAGAEKAEDHRGAPSRRRPGPRPRDDWPMWFAAQLIRVVCELGGKLPANASRTAKDLCTLYSQSRDDGWAPEESAARKLVGELFRPARSISP